MHMVENIHHGPDPWLDAVTRPVLLGRHTSWVDETVPSSGGRVTSAETSKTGGAHLADGQSTAAGRPG